MNIIQRVKFIPYPLEGIKIAIFCRRNTVPDHISLHTVSLANKAQGLFFSYQAPTHGCSFFNFYLYLKTPSAISLCQLLHSLTALILWVVGHCRTNCDEYFCLMCWPLIFCIAETPVSIHCLFSSKMPVGIAAPIPSGVLVHLRCPEITQFDNDRVVIAVAHLENGGSSLIPFSRLLMPTWGAFKSWGLLKYPPWKQIKLWSRVPTVYIHRFQILYLEVNHVWGT